MLSIEQLREELNDVLAEQSQVRSVLLIHPDYSRNDFTHVLTPMLYEALAAKGLERLDTLNAGGTHRAMSEDELVKKLGVEKREHFPRIGSMLNHEFDNPEQLLHVVDLPASFVAEKTAGNLNCPLSVDVNKLVTEDYDLIVAMSGTVPHEALGYSGGTKIFFPGISGPNVIAMLHWAAVLMGIPKIIGTVDNPARDVVNAGTKEIFKLIGSTPVLSLNMVYTENEAHEAIPRGLFTGYGFDGFVDAHKAASQLSSELHVVYLDQPKNTIVQQLPVMYDEVWTAGKGSYKLQRPGVLAEGGEIILHAPHIDCFHSNEAMDAAIRQIGYHGLEYVLNFCEENPTFDKNVASHVINVRGFGSMRNGVEEFPFKVTLASKISQAECEAVGLGYRDPASLDESQFNSAESNDTGKLWISDGGQWLYSPK